MDDLEAQAAQLRKLIFNEKNVSVLKEKIKENVDEIRRSHTDSEETLSEILHYAVVSSNQTAISALMTQNVAPSQATVSMAERRGLTLFYKRTDLDY